MQITKIEYDLINETKCGDEPLYILMAGYAPKDEPDELFKALVHLVELRYLECFSDDKSRPRPLKVIYEDLETYFKIRKKFKENLDEYPENCPEYHFYATAVGINQLSDEDKPVPAS